MALDKQVLRTCQECAMEHIDDIEAALLAVKRRLKLPKMTALVAELVDWALREQIHLARHRSNGKLRKAHGAYGGPAKVGSSAALNDVADWVWQKNVFNHTIAGWRFGEIDKGDLPAFAKAEDAKADGCRFNAMLCREAASLCAGKPGQTVEECLTEKQVKALFKKIGKQLGRAA